MSPEERQLLANLFDRVRGQAGAARDAEAEAFIADAVRAQPYAPYLLAQAVIVQEQALKGADQRIQQLQAQIQQAQTQIQQLQAQQSQTAPQGGGFLGGLFGGGSRPAPQPAPQPSPWGAPQSGNWGGPQGAPQANPWGAPQGGPQGGPWGGQPQQQGGGFLRNALGAAAGVAGGVLLADSLRGMFSGGHGASALGGLPLSNPLGGAENAALGGGETIVNNFFENPQGGADKSGDDQNAGYSDADFSADDFGGDDYSSDV